MQQEWSGRPYHALDAYLKQTYGEKCYKIALDGGMTCPNRDGTLGTSGCAFCSAGGSGEFAVSRSIGSVAEQLASGRRLFHEKKTGSRFIAYFQSYTNTYAPVSYLEKLYTDALSQPDVIGISIATRPDCLGEEVLTLLTNLQKHWQSKFIWVELGLQTIHEDTAARMRRGYPLSVFETAAAALTRCRIPFIVHLILGLPGETDEDMYASCAYLNRIPLADAPPFGVKLQLLHLLRGSTLGEDYLHGRLSSYTPLTQEAYLEILIHCLELLNPEIVIHRLTGDGAKELLLAPLWSLNKRNVLNVLHRTMRLRQTFQGRCFYDAGSADPL